MRIGSYGSCIVIRPLGRRQEIWPIIFRFFLSDDIDQPQKGIRPPKYTSRTVNDLDMLSNLDQIACPVKGIEAKVCIIGNSMAIDGHHEFLIVIGNDTATTDGHIVAVPFHIESCCEFEQF